MSRLLLFNLKYSIQYNYQYKIHGELTSQCHKTMLLKYVTLSFNPVFNKKGNLTSFLNEVFILQLVLLTWKNSLFYNILKLFGATYYVHI